MVLLWAAEEDARDQDNLDPPRPRIVDRLRVCGVRMTTFARAQWRVALEATGREAGKIDRLRAASAAALAQSGSGTPCAGFERGCSGAIAR